MSWRDADFSVSFFIFYKLTLLQNFHFYKYLAQGYSRLQTPAYKTKRKGEILKEVFVKALLCRNPFSFAVPSSFQNQAAICLSTANIGIIFQSTKFFRENFCRARLFPKITSCFRLLSFASSPLSVFTSVNTFHISLYPPSPFFTLSPSSPKPPIAILQFFLLLIYP